MRGLSQIKEPWRLERGGIIDRRTRIPFKVDGASLEGFAGDTLASAMLAQGRHVMGRSFKYHRPRGVMTAGSEEPNALVELRSGPRREPNTKASTIELFAGLDACTQNRWPSVNFDLLRVTSLFAPILGAGFYYKTFMWPSSFWENVYEPLIRRAAGLGRVSGEADPDHYEHCYVACDVLIVGAGPTGLAAALAAARSGARVIVCDEDFIFGGRLLAERQEINGTSGVAWAQSVVAELRNYAEVRLLPRTTVFGAYDSGVYGALERLLDHIGSPDCNQPRQRLWHIAAKRIVLASGATERGIVFGGNDRPATMVAGAIRTYLNRFAVLVGRRVAVFTNNDSGWRTAQDLRANGVTVEAVIDVREAVPDVAMAGIDTRVITRGRIIATKGGRRIRGLTFMSAAGKGTIDCDALAVSGGWNPNIGLSTHLGGRPAWRDDIAAFVPGSAPKEMTVAGAANGTFTLARCLAEGDRVGRAAAEALGFKVPKEAQYRADDEPATIRAFWYVAESTQKAIVDFQNDVSASDIRIAEREGFRSAEHLKRYTTLGMATDQGRSANVLGLAMMAELTGESIPNVGTTRHRAPYTPVAIGVFAGHHRGKAFRPIRRTSSHDWALAQGAVFTESGMWLRAQYFPRSGDKDWLETASREVRGVREGVGFCDVSTLGKIELQGPDVGIFLDRLYVNTFSTLPVGRVRYGLMLREDGFALDDGTVTRLDDNRFFMTTTTANASRVFQHMHFCHQVLWPELDVQFVSVTDQWAQFSVAGPNARRALQDIVDRRYDIGNAALPYMGAMVITVCGGIAARLYRISFSGELAYEIGVPARYGNSMANVLMEVGAAHGMIPYGTEALGVMRIEKGHPAGSEFDGRTTARDLGLGKMMSSKKDYIGRVLAGRAALLDPSRPSIIGVRPVNPSHRLRAGAHLIPINAEIRAENDEGVVTSVAFSPSLGHWIGLGFLQRGSERFGQYVQAADPLHNDTILVEACASCFLDPRGERLHA